jgi:hypothetical protein
MVVVVALLGFTLASIFAVIQLLSQSAAMTTTDSSAANDLSYNMSLVSKAIMDSRVLYASDYRIVVLDQLDSGAYEVDSIYTTASAGGLIGNLVWERWSTDASATAPTGVHSQWVMSARDANLTSSAPTPLFEYFKDQTDASLMSAASGDEATAPVSSVAAFVGTMPGGYTISAIRRVRLHVATLFTHGIRDDTRDILLRMGG